MAVRRKGSKVRTRKASGSRQKPVRKAPSARKKTAGKSTRKKATTKVRKKKAGKKAENKAKTNTKAKQTTRKKATAAAPRSRRAHRLKPDVFPGDVDLHVEVDPSSSRTYKGEVSHHLTLERPRRSIELHAHEIRVTRPRLEVDGEIRRGRLVAHPERETVEIQFDEGIPAGEAILQLSFAGKLRDDLRGLYAASAEDRRYAFTQLEAADARHFFPCFDEPAFKARFEVSVTTASANSVISNSPAEKVEPLGGRRKRVRFERTPLLSPYLLALAVGELEASKPTRCGDTEIIVWHVPGKGKLTAFALEAARETLARLEKYFDLPYPYAKLDLVAVPEFEAGAMENAGAVFFRETLLLLDPETSTLQEQKRVAEVICHELAHMWYGDLVTMAWWNDLWLNEAFATWMAFQIVDAWKPEWKMWQDFQHHRAAALTLDALDHTHPIYMEVRTPSDATENFDLITYEKGASVVRMLERYLGAKAFRSGVRSYIREHRESNTVASDLWSALSEASGQAVEPVVRAWIEQPGFPLLRLQRTEERGRTTLSLSQERFQARRAGSARTGRSGRGPGSWPIPWVGRVGTSGKRGTRVVRHLLGKRRDEILLEGKAPRFVYGNADEGGFFRPLHDEAELRALAGSLGALTAVERMGLAGHQWAAVRAQRASIESFLDLAMAFGKEGDADVLTTLRSPLGFIADRLAPAAGTDGAQALSQRLIEVFGGALKGLGLDSEAREPTETRLRRAALFSILGEVAEWDWVMVGASERCLAYLKDRRALDPNLADVVVSLAARRGDEKLFGRFLAAAEKAHTPQERRRMLMALGDFRDERLVDRALGLCLTPAVGTQDVAILLTRMLGNRGARERAWAFMQKRWKALRKRMTPMLVTRPIDATPALGTRAYRNEVAAFFRANPVPTAARAVRQALERFDLDLAFREKAAPGLERWLQED